MDIPGAWFWYQDSTSCSPSTHGGPRSTSSALSTPPRALQRPWTCGPGSPGLRSSDLICSKLSRACTLPSWPAKICPPVQSAGLWICSSRFAWAFHRNWPRERYVRQSEGLSEKSLCVALRSLERRLAGGSSERAQTWNDEIEPWLKDYWPREGSRNSAVTSEHMMHLVIGSGDSFPEAVSFCTRFLKPVESHHWGIVYLKEHIEKHPAAVLEFLSRVVQVDLPQHFRPDLREILEAVAGVQQELREEPSFRRLHQIASGG